MSSSPRHATALAYAQRGVPVFPCLIGTKIPATANGQNDATTNPDTINAWWAEADYNVAAMPDSMGMAVVDLDPGYDELVADGLPATFTVQSPRGGKHLYYRGKTPPTQGRNQRSLGEHIDTRGGKSYVLLPTSYTADGSYKVVDNRPVADLPAWVSDTLARAQSDITPDTADLDLPHNTRKAERYVADRIARGDVAIQGQNGDARTLQMFNVLGDLGLSVGNALTVIQPWNDASLPPWDNDDLAVKAKNAYEYRHDGLGNMAPPPADLHAMAAAAGLDQPAPWVSEWEDEAQMESAKEAPWLIQNWLPDEGVTMIYGRSQHFKSFVALDMALCVATGQAWAGHQTVRSGLVFYAAGEGRSALGKRRRRAWKAINHAGPIDNFLLGKVPTVADPGNVEHWCSGVRREAEHRGIPVALVVIDTAAKALYGLNEDTAQDSGKLTHLAQTIAEGLHCAVILIHHASDKGERKDMRPRGASAWVGNVDSVIQVWRPNMEMLTEVTAEKMKDEELPRPLTFELVKQADSLVTKLTTRRPSSGLGSEVALSRAVQTILLTVGAIGFEKGIQTHVLAARILPDIPGQAPEERLHQLAELDARLNKAARASLSAFATKVGRDFRWHLQGS
jgi:hypothetical protein